MAELLFKRRCDVTIGTRSGSDQKVYSEQFKIDFSVTRTIDGRTPDTCTCTIYNADESLFINFLELEDAFIRIEAGYGENFGTIFDGDVVFAYQNYKGPDRVTVIEAKDGEKAINDATLVKSYAPKVSIKDIVNDLVGTLKTVGKVTVSSIASGNIKNLTKKLDFGVIMKGNSTKQLENLLAKSGYQFNIANNTLYIHQGSVQEFVINLTLKTGLIGSPRTKQVDLLKGKKKQIVTGVEFEALLQPRLIPSQEVTIESDLIDGLYKIRDISYTGSTRGGSWKASGFAI